MKAQLSLELLIYITLAGLSLLFALASAERIMQAYHIQNLFRFGCIAALKNASLACAQLAYPPRSLAGERTARVLNRSHKDKAFR